MAERDGGDAILEALRRLRVDYILSSPGSECAPVWEALIKQEMRNEPGPGYIECGHETLAVNVAAGYTSYTGRMQAVMLHAGAGLLQGALGIRSALLSELPMLIFSGESLTFGEDSSFEPGMQWYRNLSVVGGPERLIEPTAKWASKATSSHTLYNTVTRAGQIAQQVPQGPVYLNIPLEVMVDPWTHESHVRDLPKPTRTRPLPDDVERVVELIRTARKPVIYTDSAGRNPEVFHLLVELADELALPVVEGRGVAFSNFPTDHPMYMGRDFKKDFHDADLVLLVANRVPWYPPSASPENCTIVVFGDTPQKEYVVYQVLNGDYQLRGELPEALRAIIEAARADAGDRDAVEARRQAWTEQHQARFGKANAPARRPDDWGSSAVEIEDLCRAVREAVPDDAIFVDETIVYTRGILSSLPRTRPQTYFRAPAGLGQGIGYALGVKLAAKEQPVVLFVGDGAFIYNPVIAALAASQRYDLPILIIVCNNGEYQSMRDTHLLLYPSGISATEGKFHGAKIHGPDYAQTAAMFGGYGACVERTSDLKNALREACETVRQGKTAVLNVVMASTDSGMWDKSANKKAG